MDAETIRVLVEEAIHNADTFDWSFYVALLIAVAIGIFLGSYLTKKAENLATKEDIAEITKKVEGVRLQLNTQLETHKASLQLSNQLKLAALDERLRKHQEAYVLWNKLLWSSDDNKKAMETAYECQEWWIKNNLYLDAEARKAFRLAFMEAGNLRIISDANERRECVKVIREAGEKLVEAVRLPSLGDDETKRMDQENRDNLISNP